MTLSRLPSTLFLGAVVALITLVSILLMPSVKTMADPDIYLHVAAGQWILENSALPLADPFSFVMKGRPWVTHEWLSQLLMAKAHDLLGWFGVLLIAAVAFAMAMALQFRFLWQRLEPIHAVALVCVSYAGLLTHFQARPHVLVWPLMAWWVSWLIGAAQRGQCPSAWLFVCMLLWTNMHGSFVLGFVLLAFVVVDTVIRDFKQWMVWARFSVLSLLVSLVNPYGWNALLFPFDLQSMELLREIREWAAPHVIDLLPVLALGLIIGSYTLLGRMRIATAYLPMILALVYQAVSHVRYVSIAAFLIPFFVRSGPWRISNARADRQMQDVSNELAPESARRSHVLILTVLFFASVFGFGYWKNYRPNPVNAPMQTIDAVIAKGISGNVLNAYNYGGYLIYRKVPVFIDGRVDLYRDHHMSRYMDTEQDKADKVRAVLRDFDIQWTIFPNQHSINRFLEQDLDWVLEHKDSDVSVFVRKNAEKLPLDIQTPVK